MSENTSVIHKPHLPFLFFLSIASALGGFLWGFDAIVISGTINPVKEQFALSSAMEGLFVSSGLIGAVLGSAASGWLSDRFGRSRNLVLSAGLMLISAAASALVLDIESLIIARWIGGIGVGISAMVCPLYISEISPTHIRGRLVTVFQFAITLGVMTALFNNYGIFSLANTLESILNNGGILHWFFVDETWRAMFAVELIPGLVFLFMALRLPESPRYLIKISKNEKAKNVLNRIFRNGANEEYEEIQKTIAEEESTRGTYTDLLQAKYKKALIIAVLLAIFSQFSGINVVFYYGASLLEKAGFNSSSALSGTAVIGIFNMIFTIIAMWLVDKIGRRPLMLIGTIGAIINLAGIGLVYGENTSIEVIIILMAGFVAFFAFSLGPIKFVFASEIFPTNVRSFAMSIVILVMWVADTIVGWVFPILRDSVGPSATFFIFAIVLIPQVFMVWKIMPETAGKSLEEIEHWYSKEKE